MIQVLETICDSCGTPALCHRLPVHNNGNTVYDYCDDCVRIHKMNNWTEYHYTAMLIPLFAAHCTRSDTCEYSKVLVATSDNMAMIRIQMSAHGNKHRWAS